MENELEFYEGGEDYTIYSNATKSAFLVVDHTYNDFDHYFLFDTKDEAYMYIRSM